MLCFTFRDFQNSPSTGLRLLGLQPRIILHQHRADFSLVLCTTGSTISKLCMRADFLCANLASGKYDKKDSGGFKKEY